MKKTKQRYCKECDVPVAKSKQRCPDHINRWKRPSATHFKCNECNVTKPKKLFSKGKYSCKPCSSYSDHKMLTYLGKGLTELLAKYRTSKLSRKKAIEITIPKHKNHIRGVKKELAEFEKRINKERKAIIYRYRRAEGNIQVNKRSIKNRKIKHADWEVDIAQYIVSNFPPSDYSNKDDWTTSMFQVTKLISKQYDIKISVLKRNINNIFGFKGTEAAWYRHIDSKIKELQPNYSGKAPWVLECIECGVDEPKPNRYSLVRSLGISGMDDKKNGGLCYVCAVHKERIPHGPRTSEQVDKMREAAILSQTPFDSVEEWMSSKVDRKEYYAAVDMVSRTNLRVNNLSLYKLYKANIYNGTNFETGLTIEHKTPKCVCHKEGWSVEQAADISNLEVLTMKENSENWVKYADKIGIKSGSGLVS